MMTEARFIELAEAYGARLDGWPAAERAAAAAWKAAQPERAATILAEAETLDAALAAAPSQAWSPELFERIVMSAPRAVTRSRLWRWLSGAGLGVGLATACAAGVAVGAVLAPVALPVLQGQTETSDDLSAMLDDASDVGVNG